MEYKSIPLLVKIVVAIGCGAGIGLIAPEILVRVMNTFCSLFSQLLGFMITLIIVGLVTPAIARVGRGAGRNGVSEDVAGFVVPLCATIHLSGSMLKITSCAIALMLMQNIGVDFWQMQGGILMLGVTMVAAPDVPGGAIMAALGSVGKHPRI